MVNSTETYNRLPEPGELGLDSKFDSWREGQEDIILAGLDSKSSYVTQVAPTGSGKSVNAIAQAILTGGRTLYLTSTKGLQDQLLSDFKSLGMVDIRGKANYQCACHPDLTCEEGGDTGCIFKGSNMCPHSEAMFRAKTSKYVTTNYACWLKNGEQFGHFDFLILDEAHNAPGELSRAMQVQISSNEVEEILGREWPKAGREKISVWKDWAKGCHHTADLRYAVLASEIEKDKKPSSSKLKRLAHLKNLGSKFQDLSSMVPGKWVVDDWAYGYTFNPINPAAFAERMLFRGIKRVLLISATVRPKTLDMLGLTADKVDFQEYKSSFDPHRSPIIFIPTVYVDRNWTGQDQARWIERIDEILEGRLDRRGIIHAGSYERTSMITERSQFGLFMRTNMRNGEPIAGVVDQYRADDPPSFLVSPSVTTGYDFPGDACRFQIITKVPFPDLGSRIVRARIQADREYSAYEAMQNLIQAAGRGMRSKEDWQEVFIIDNHVSKFIYSNGHLAPRWFQVFYRSELRVPRAPKLGRV